MRNISWSILLVLAIIGMTRCTDSSVKETETEQVTYQCPMKCEGEKTYSESGTCPVCNMDLLPKEGNPILSDEISEESIFNLTSQWTNQNQEVLELKDLKGKVLVVAMIYTSCKAACPRLVADMRNIQKEMGKNPEVNYVMVSIDPETDTPERLKQFAIENRMDNSQWTLPKWFFR